MKENGHLYLSIGPLMRAARKFKKLNQAEVAQAIGCSQSALSKMEHNLLVPSAPQWFLFSRLTEIPPECIETGIIDRHLKVIVGNQSISLGHRIPKKYSLFKSEKVLEVYPFLNFLNKEFGGATRMSLLKSLGFEEEFFIDFDNLINFQFFIDLFQYFLDKKLTSAEDLKRIVSLGQDEVFRTHYPIDPRSPPKKIIDDFIKQSMSSQGDFVLKMDEDNGRILLSYYPEYHLKKMKSLNSSKNSSKNSNKNSTRIASFLNRYRLETLRALFKSGPFDPEKDISHLPEVSTSIWGARFEIRI